MEQQIDIAQMRAITISRQYGSGGGEVARRLAQRLQWRLFDHQVVMQVAREMGISQEAADEHDESLPGIWEQIWQSLQFIQPPVGVEVPIAAMPTEMRVYLKTLRGVIDTAYNAGHVVIVGRESQVLLAARSDVLHVRVVAPLEQRIRYVMQREGLSQREAQERISKKDASRNQLLKTEYHESPDNPLLYDLVANADFLPLDQVVDLVLLALATKAHQHLLDAQQRGPASDVARYTCPEQDFSSQIDTSTTVESPPNQ
jgi:cytidylate kinase